MNSYRKQINITTKNKEEVINISSEVSEIVRESGIQEGLVLVFPLHTSSAVYLSDSDPSLTEDFCSVLKDLVPEGQGYLHDQVDYKKNADAHMKANLSGHHIVLPLTAGKLDLGVYQTLYYAEFDGTRPKEILVKILGY